MPRHKSTTRAKQADAAFPIRIRLVVPDTGFGTRIDDMLAWLRRLPANSHDWQGGGTGGSGWNVHHTTQVYFRSIDDAHGFIHAFPELELSGSEWVEIPRLSYDQSGAVPLQHARQTGDGSA